ncbi:MAG: ABC transporter permease [Eubacterium sp.]|nr:ABC transporter permease [Eubacterium sp.]
MFWHNLKYEVLTTIRVRDLIMWMMIFPVVLGAFFKIAFGSIYEKDTLFDTIPTAVVEDTKNEVFHSVIDEMEKGDNPLLKVSYLSESDAMKALENDEVKGILFVSDKVTLKIKNSGYEQTILKKFAERYMAQESIILNTVATNPMQLETVVKVLSQDMTIKEDRPMTDGNTDPFVTYMYNLIAMVAMFGSVTGLHIAVANQANLSQLGARRNCAPTPKIITVVTGLLGSYLAQAVCVVICVTFQALVLGVDYGTRLPLVYLGGILGGVMGVSIGFFVGSISTWSEGFKVGVVMSVSMVMCFLSGLMFGDIKAILEIHAPIVNDLNPAALVADSFYYLNVDADLSRFFMRILMIVGYAMVFAIGGLFMTRRRRYASL